MVGHQEVSPGGGCAEWSRWREGRAPPGNQERGHGQCQWAPTFLGGPRDLKGLRGCRTLLAWGRLHAPCVCAAYPPCHFPQPCPHSRLARGTVPSPGMDRPVHVPLRPSSPPPATPGTPSLDGGAHSHLHRLVGLRRAAWAALAPVPQVALALRSTCFARPLCLPPQHPVLSWVGG